MTRQSGLDQLCKRLGIEIEYRDDWGRMRRVSEKTKRALLAALGYAADSPRAIRAALRQVETAGPGVVDDPSPSHCYLPEALTGDGRIWGIAVQLYGLRSERNWGIGDFSDLASLIDLASDLGAGAIGLNPLHALFSGQPERASPYAGSSRQFLNILYIDVEAVAEFTECAEARRHVAAPAFQARLGELRATPLVDYAGVAACKLPVFELLHRRFRDNHLAPNSESERGRAFRAFVANRGEPLERHVVFEALWERYATEYSTDWRAWPESLRRPASPEVARFAAANAARIEFFAYVQWLADLQLKAAANRCKERGMPVGLYVDLAVGVANDGAETWAYQDVLLDTVAIGAPPDRWNPFGQNWGIGPYHPGRLRELGYAPFAQAIAANMRHAGALRIDHVLGLMRLYWVPQNHAPEEGGYVRYPLDQLLDVLAAESQRFRCLVVGEDLGTMPEGIRERLAEKYILSYRVLYFERGPDGAFLPPSAYPYLAVATVTTHDLPTLAGYWTAHDLDIRARLGLFLSPSLAQEERDGRARDRDALVAALRAEGLLTTGGSPSAALDQATVEAVHGYLARTPSRLAIIHIEDVLRTEDQPNVPGTPDAPPNWRRKLDITLEDLARDQRLVRIGEIMSEVRSQTSK